VQVSELLCDERTALKQFELTEVMKWYVSMERDTEKDTCILSSVSHKKLSVLTLLEI
jgi:hypothetical protein